MNRQTAGLNVNNPNEAKRLGDEGEPPEQHNEKGDVVELPIGIKLNDFYMEEYPPRFN